MEKEKDGVWRTIRGRRVFIRSGESLGSAMSRSGKFKREDIREGKKDEILSSGLRKKLKNDNKYGDKKDYKIDRKNYNKIEKRYPSIVKDNQAEKNRINENAHIEGSGKTRVQRNWNKYSEADRTEHRHELIQKKLAEYRNSKLPESVRKLNDEKPNHKVVEVDKTKYHEVGNGQWRSEKDGYDYDIDFNMKNKDNPRVRDVNTHKVIEDFKAKKQSNNKVDGVKTLTGNYERDNKGNIVTQKEYDDFREAYKKDKISKEDYLNNNYDVIRNNKQSNNKITQGEPLKDLANDRIKEKQNTLANDKAMLEVMKRKGIKEVNGWTEKDFENRIKKNENYLEQSNNKIENNDEFDMRKYTIELQHDKGTKKIDTVASNKESAIKNVLKSENAPNNAVKSVKDNGSILNKQSNNKIVSDWENGAISDEEALKRFNGDKELATKTFENMGYKSPFKQSNNKQKTQWENFEINDNIRGIYNKENGDVVYTTGKGANIQSYKSSIDKLKKEDFPHTHEGLVRNYLENKQSNNKQDTIKNYVEKKKSNRLTKEDKNYNDTKNDILEGFTEDYGYGDTTPEKAFIEQIDTLKTNSKGQQYKSIYEAGKEYASGASGTMLVANSDMVDYLKKKGIKANINNAFDKYTDYMAKNIEKMYNELKKKGK